MYRRRCRCICSYYCILKYHMLLQLIGHGSNNTTARITLRCHVHLDFDNNYGTTILEMNPTVVDPRSPILSIPVLTKFYLPFHCNQHHYFQNHHRPCNHNSHPLQVSYPEPAYECGPCGDEHYHTRREVSSDNRK